MELSRFIKSPGLIMDRFLKGYPQRVQMAGEPVGIVSLGEPAEARSWSDMHGRPWQTYIWKSKRTDMQFVLHCTPEVEGVTCRSINKSTGTETFDDGLAFRELADRILIHYGGTIKSWKEFLNLDKAWLPKEFDKMTIQDGKTLKIQMGRVHYEAGAIPAESKISVFTAFDPLDRVQIIPSSLIVSRDLNKETYDVITNVFRPSEDATQEEKRLWSALLSNQNPYDGTIRVLGDHFIVEAPLTNSRAPSAVDKKSESAFVFSCTRSSKLAKQKVLEECSRARAQISLFKETNLVQK